MNKVVLIIGILFAQSAFADGQNLQMVLEKAHEQGFYGCDSAMSSRISVDDVRRVETTLVNESISRFDAQGPAKDKNTVLIDVAEVHGAFNSVKTWMVQKKIDKCLVSTLHETRVFPKMSCQSMMNKNSLIANAETGSFVWARQNWQSNNQSMVVLLDIGNGGCAQIYRADGNSVYILDVDTPTSK